MKIFLAGIMQGSIVEAAIHQQNWRESVKQVVARRLPDAQVYCHYSQHPNSITYDLPEIRSTLAQGNHMAGTCDLLIAFVPGASMGTAIEMHEAARGGAVVLTISPLKANWVIRTYSDRIFDDVIGLENFLGSDEFHALFKAKKRV